MFVRVANPFSLSLLTIGCANAAATSEVCSLEIENTLSEEIIVAVGQVKILNDGKNYYDWNSVGTENIPENGIKFLPWSKVQGKGIIEIFGYPDEGYDFYIWAGIPDGPWNDWGFPKSAKKAFIYRQDNKIIVSPAKKIK